MGANKSGPTKKVWTSSTENNLELHNTIYYYTIEQRQILSNCKLSADTDGPYLDIFLEDQKKYQQIWP